jgi:hypothetical protein
MPMEFGLFVSAWLLSIGLKCISYGFYERNISMDIQSPLKLSEIDLNDLPNVSQLCFTHSLNESNDLNQLKDTLNIINCTRDVCLRTQINVTQR